MREFLFSMMVLVFAGQSFGAAVDLQPTERARSPMHGPLTGGSIGVVSGKSHVVGLFSQKLDSVVAAGSTKTEYVYGENGFVKTTTNSSWDLSNARWKPEARIEFVFDLYGNMLMDSTFAWDTLKSAWSLSQKDVQVLDPVDANLLPLCDTIFSWDTAGKVWSNKTLTEYKSNSNNELMSLYEYSWKTNSNTWDTVFKSSYTIDANGNQSSGITYSKSSSTSPWVNYLKFDDSSDVAGNILASTNYFKDYASDSLVLSYRMQVTYDFLTPITDLEFAFANELGLWVGNIKHKNKVVNFESFNWDTTNGWVSYQLSTYYYSPFTSPIQTAQHSLSNKGFSIVQSPAILHLSFPSATHKTATLYTTSGRNLLHTEINSLTANLDIANLSPGSYILGISEEGGKLQTCTFVKT